MLTKFRGHFSLHNLVLMIANQKNLVRFLCISGFGDLGGLGQLSGDFGGAGVPRTLIGKKFQASIFKD